MQPDSPTANIFFIRPLNQAEIVEIQTLIFRHGPVKIKLYISLSVMVISFLLLTGSYNSTSGYFQTTQGAMMGIVFLIVFLISLGFVFLTLNQKSKASSLEKDLTTGLFRSEGEIQRITPQSVKVGNYTFSTQNFSTADLKIGDRIFVEFTEGSFHVFSLGKLNPA